MPRELRPKTQHSKNVDRGNIFLIFYFLLLFFLFLERRVYIYIYKKKLNRLWKVQGIESSNTGDERWFYPFSSTHNELNNGNLPDDR